MPDLSRGPSGSMDLPGGQPGSPAWWVTRLARKIQDDRATMDLWWRYIIGDFPPPAMPDKVRDRVMTRYNAVVRRSRTPMMGSVIEAAGERMRPIGFRLGSASDFEDDHASWGIWQASMMDADAPLAIDTALGKGRGYLSVWQRSGEPLPRIAVEDPTQTIVEHEPGNRHRRVAALKTYQDPWTGKDRADLFLRASGSTPAGLYRFIRDGVVSSSSLGGWVQMSGNDAFEANPFGWDGIPIVPLINNPQLGNVKIVDRHHLKHGGDSDIGDVTYIQDRLNEIALNRLIAQWFAAFKQRWATGITLEEEQAKGSDGELLVDDDGKPIMVPVEPFDVFLDRMLVVDDEKVKFGEFEASDLSQYIQSEEREIQHLSTIKRIPRHYLFQEGQSPSGDAIKSAETGLVARVRRKMLVLGDSFEEAMRVARTFSGQGVAAPDSEIVWDDPEFRSYGELVDGVIKEFSAGLVPWEGAMEKLGYSPQQIARFRGQRNMDALLRAMESEDPTEQVAA